MGRPRSVNKGLPPRMHKKGEAHYWVHGGKWIALGKEWREVLKKYAELERVPIGDIPVAKGADAMFAEVANKYKAVVLPTKAPATQRGNELELERLLRAFGNVRLESITARHVQQYLEARTAKVRANREKALLSHIWNWARSQGITNQANPCQGIKGNKEMGRSVLVGEELFQKIYAQADGPTRDAMRLALLVGLRPNDVLPLKFTDVSEGVLHATIRKTRKQGVSKLRFEVTGELAALIEELKTRTFAGSAATTLHLIRNERGQPLGYSALNDRIAKARAAAGVAKEDFQFRDLRARAITDVADQTGDMRRAQRFAGHAQQTMTEHYVRYKAGARVKPVR